jgi:hypothetical protein
MIAALSISSQTGILALSKSQKDENYENDRDNPEKTETYNSMILSNENDEIRILGNKGQKNNQIKLLGNEVEEDDQIEMLRNKVEKHD